MAALKFFTLTDLSVVLLLVLVLLQICSAQNRHRCPPSSCGNIPINYPFRLRGDPEHCGYPLYELVCENNITVLYISEGKYHVQAIDYNKVTIRLVDAAVQKDNCSTIPRHSLLRPNFTAASPFNWIGSYNEQPRVATFMKCLNPVKKEDFPRYVDTAPCVNGTSYSYVMLGGDLTDVGDACTVELIVPSSLPIRGNVGNVSFLDVHNDLVDGFELVWYQVACISCRGAEVCYLLSGSTPDCSASTETFFYWINYTFTYQRLLILLVIGVIVVARLIFLGPCVLGFVIFRWRRRHLSMFEGVEEFLRSQNNFTPVRYSYSDIKKMTNNFRDKLGQGGYGSVYKGKLRSGQFAAIKLLLSNDSKGNGQDFINEVATIGRIHHVNVVRLVGYCAERSKRALVYEFMPNGSLDKYTSSYGGADGNVILSWNRMFKICSGVARGIEYLHRGCDMQILHFDIKPHNILLDENFTPKVSDFGLAKLRPAASDNTMSLTAARGTIGYIAPELFYKNIGRVSYKADVYSFGMLLMEMAGKRKGPTNPVDSSGSYFPNWVYNQVVSGEVESGETTTTTTTEDEKVVAKKMVMVALWCIQMKPENRPSMGRVVEMLEGDLETLPLPPKPGLYPDATPVIGEEGYSDESSWSSSLYSDETISLVTSSE
ncbi:unnamed protein product [Linum tenue]|uniref:Protein kinase domain-containing protein n=1 Tax=Linum tenue TaxID=586396 RepID=A0AAV0JSB9_9ROSI|nr:unnamed protein product [Linum tenue]